jgi:predicted translin family RNA/ssDNA-binding protein
MDFTQNNEESIKEGLKLLGQAIEVLPDAITACQATVSEAEKLYQMLKAFSSPTSFAWHVAKDLIVNGVQIYDDINGAIKAYSQQNYQLMGYDSGHALAEVLIGASSSEIRTPKAFLLTAADVEKIFLGVLEGAGAEANATDIAPCIKDTATISGLLASAVQDFAQKDEADIKAGLKLLGQAIESLPDAMTECQAAVTEAQRLYEMIANFKSPSSFIWHVAEDLIVNGVQIYKDINAAEQAYQSLAWESFGYDVGHALAEVFVGSSQIVKTPNTYLLGLDQVEQIFLGVLEGIGAEANLTDIVPCIKDASSISSLLAQAIVDFAAKDEDHVKAGLKLLGEAIEELPDAMTACQAAVQEAESLYNMINNFKSPASFAWHVAKDLIVNGVQIYDDINAAISAYDAQSWESFGYDSGHAIALVFIGASKEIKTPNTYLITANEVEQIFLGVLEGVGAEANVTDLVPCISDVSTTSSLLAQAIVDFASKDETRIKDGLRLLGQAIEALPDAMTQCQAAVSEAEKLYEMIKNFKSPSSFAWHVAKDLIVNGVQIYKDVEGAVAAYDSQSWETFGYDVGHALAEVFVGVAVNENSARGFLQ